MKSCSPVVIADARLDQAHDSRHPNGCECIFCLSVCTECGSDRVEVSFTTAYTYDRSKPNHLLARARRHQLAMHCKACGTLYPNGHPSMQKLLRSLAQAVGLAARYELSISVNGHIELKRSL